MYRAICANTGQEVAVKVQRPGILPIIALDVYILRLMLMWVRKVAGINQDIGKIADEVGEGLYGELDYWREARQSQLFAQAHAHLHYVKVPRVLEELTSSRCGVGVAWGGWDGARVREGVYYVRGVALVKVVRGDNTLVGGGGNEQPGCIEPGCMEVVWRYYGARLYGSWGKLQGARTNCICSRS